MVAIGVLLCLLSIFVDVTVKIGVGAFTDQQ